MVGNGMESDCSALTKLRSTGAFAQTSLRTYFMYIILLMVSWPFATKCGADSVSLENHTTVPSDPPISHYSPSYNETRHKLKWTIKIKHLCVCLCYPRPKWYIVRGKRRERFWNLPRRIRCVQESTFSRWGDPNPTGRERRKRQEVNNVIKSPAVSGVRPSVEKSRWGRVGDLLRARRSLPWSPGDRKEKAGGLCRDMADAALRSG